MSNSLVDIGVNLTNKAFRNDLDEVIDRAVAAGVDRMVLTGTSEGASKDAAALAATRPGVLYSTAGVHPHDASSCTDSTIETLRELAGREPVVAIGECGLDYNRDFSPRDVQRRWFEAQVELAAELDMPLFLHERDAAADTRAILARHRDRFPRAVIHCYTGDGDTLASYLEMDLHIGITGWICDERRGTHLRDLVQTIPLERLMIETDAPYLVPRTLRPKPKKGRNEPAFLPHIAETIAECYGVSVAELAAATTATAEAFFALPASNA